MKIMSNIKARIANFSAPNKGTRAIESVKVFPDPMQPVVDACNNELARRQALAFARKVWAKQSESLPRDVRIERVRKALEAQNMSMEGVSL